MLGTAVLIMATLTLTGCGVLEGVTGNGELTRTKAKKMLETYYQDAVVVDDRTFFECDPEDCALFERSTISFAHYQDWMGDDVVADREEFRSRLVSGGFVDEFKEERAPWAMNHVHSIYSFDDDQKVLGHLGGGNQIVFADVEDIEVTGIVSAAADGSMAVAEYRISLSVRPELRHVYGSGQREISAKHRFQKYDDGWRLQEEYGGVATFSDELPVAGAIINTSRQLISFKR